ncbi:Pr6Pr family membrane protein [Streptacidiphilus rugosus]|uniref:Pr6Pr family membrane protein n=1 Tax=Streptacidiphilus rugosus TaxID=405783 RepID=UPI00068D2285|nr:Pr6Pr family membrane protein [Streptacidiphilus rugosus]
MSQQRYAGPASPRIVAALRLAFGVLTAVALGVQADHTVSVVNGTMGNFFSYFTIESNIAMTVVLLAGGVLGLTGRAGVPDLLRGAVTLYMVITGVVYAVALSGYPLLGTVPWVNDVVHRLMPVVVLVDWLAVPPRRRLRYSEALSWLVFPLLYLPYTLIRGPIVDWYPYPFLDPREKGYGHVVVSSLVITLAFFAVGALLVWAGNLFGRRRATAADPLVTP